MKTSYTWALDVLRKKSSDVELQQQLSVVESALVFSIYYISASSLHDDECKTLLQQSRSSLLSQYQATCEEALLRTNLLCMNDILVMKAIIFYMVCKHTTATDRDR